jgi:hypothetical protein
MPTEHEYRNKVTFEHNHYRFTDDAFDAVITLVGTSREALVDRYVERTGEFPPKTYTRLELMCCLADFAQGGFDNERTISLAQYPIMWRDYV